jgi:arginyl-tRNA synthetase
MITLDDVMDMIGVDAARYQLARSSTDQNLVLDVDLLTSTKNENPVYYVQYAHARIAGILRNAPDRASDELSLAAALEPAERELVKRLADFPGVVAEATARRGPQMIPTYAIRVADDFHRFYHDVRVLESESEAFRLALCRATQSVIARCLDLVGVEAPERM